MNCYICNKDNCAGVFKKNELQLIKCLSCGVVQVCEPPRVFDLKLYDYYKGKANLSREELYNPITRKRFIDLLARFECYRKNNTLLDIGCGEGQFLAAAKERGWQVEGVEIAPDAVQICRRFNLPEVICGNFLELGLKKDHFDIITMFEVLEHLTKPNEFLLKAHKSLRVGGALWITTPNFNSLNRLILQNRWRWVHQEHLFYFTVSSLRRVLRAAGFEIIELKTRHIDLPEILSTLKKQSQETICSTNKKLREDIEKNVFLSFLKATANMFLSMAGVGESIQCLCRKV